MTTSCLCAGGCELSTEPGHDLCAECEKAGCDVRPLGPAFECDECHAPFLTTGQGPHIMTLACCEGHGLMLALAVHIAECELCDPTQRTNAAEFAGEIAIVIARNNLRDIASQN